jgi:hypothetical protein
MTIKNILLACSGEDAYGSSLRHAIQLAGFHARGVAHEVLKTARVPVIMSHQGDT